METWQDPQLHPNNSSHKCFTALVRVTTTTSCRREHSLSYETVRVPSLHRRPSSVVRPSKQERDNGLPFEVGVLLLVSTVLLECPLGHLGKSDEHKHPHDKDVGHNRKRDPRHDLKHVVRARHNVEEPALGRGALIRSFLGAHVAQLEMHHAVQNLRDHHHGTRSERDSVAGRGVVRVAKDVANGGSESPVVGAVLEQVAQWHRRPAELVHEEGLQLALQVVEDPQRNTEDGRKVHRFLGRAFPVDDRRPQSEKRHNGHRTKVLPEKHATVAELRAIVLHNKADISSDFIVSQCFVHSRKPYHCRLAFAVLLRGVLELDPLAESVDLDCETETDPMESCVLG